MVTAHVIHPIDYQVEKGEHEDASDQEQADRHEVLQDLSNLVDELSRRLEYLQGHGASRKVHGRANDKDKQARFLIIFAQRHETVGNHERARCYVVVVLEPDKIPATFQAHLIDFEARECKIDNEQVEEGPLLPHIEYDIARMQGAVKDVN